MIRPKIPTKNMINPVSWILKPDRRQVTAHRRTAPTAMRNRELPIYMLLRNPRLFRDLTAAPNTSRARYDRGTFQPPPSGCPCQRATRHDEAVIDYFLLGRPAAYPQMRSSTPAAISPSAATEDQQHQHYDQDYEPNTHSNSLPSGRALELGSLILLLRSILL